jgi:hypothetical protein
MTTISDILRRFETDVSRKQSLTDEDRQVFDRELNRIIITVAKCDSMESAQGDLLELGRVQEILATLTFRYGAQLSARQRQIVREYDRCDLPEVRQSTFNKIKSDQFPWTCV